MSCRSDEEDDAARPPPGFTTQTKAIRNDGAGHVGSDAERMDTKSDADVEKQFDESTGKKRNYAGRHSYRFIKEWDTGPRALLDDTVIDHEIYT